jgi:hypothetical protein
VPDDKRRSIIADIQSDSPGLKLLYATPESLRNPTLREALQVRRGRMRACVLAPFQPARAGG